MDANRRGLAILGSIFVVLFIVQGVILLTRSSVSHRVTHVRVHPTGVRTCVPPACTEFPSSRRYLVTFAVAEHGTTERPACTVTVAGRSGSGGGRAAMFPASKDRALWQGSVEVDGPLLGLSPKALKIDCR